jgi:ubiquinone/menaquinone biosynthesis C-methylase UbiE
MLSEVQAKWTRSYNFWQGKLARQGTSYVGRIGEDHNYQTQLIERLYWSRVGSDAYFSDALDFGCGYGRFTSMLSSSCGHVWAVDMLEDMLAQVRGVVPNVTPIKCSWPPKLLNQDKSMDLLWVCLVFQHIVDDDLFLGTVKELSRLLKSGARVIIIDNAVDHASHVKPRGPDVLMEALGAKVTYADKVTINKRANDHWLIDGKVC